MNYKILLLFLFLLPQFLFSQDKIKIITDNENKSSDLSIIFRNEVVYISLTELADVLNLKHDYNNLSQKIVIYSLDKKLIYSIKNPFIVVQQSGANEKIFQMPGSTFIMEGSVYAPLSFSIRFFNYVSGKYFVYNDKLNLIYPEQTKTPSIDIEKLEDFKPQSKFNLYGISLTEDQNSLLIKLKSDNRVAANIQRFDGSKLSVKILRATIDTTFIEGKSKAKSIKQIQVKKYDDYSEFLIDFNVAYKTCEIIKSPGNNDIHIKLEFNLQEDWFIKESEHFRIIFRSNNDYLTDHILESAETSLKVLSDLFKYIPSEKIVIAAFDIHDYGFGAATTVPVNFIRLEIEPFEPGYENVPLNERYQWILNHELVHIIVNDHSSGVENFFRTLFSKVAPEQPQPITIPASLLTNSNRFTPRWHQESIAVFLETWLSGGFGRTLGNFDEMFFRSLVEEKKQFAGYVEIDAELAQKNYLLETLNYLYGGRFATYLFIKFGYEKLFNWFITKNTEFFPGYKSKFENVFGKNFSETWDDFIEYEKKFQQKNIEKLKATGTTEVRYISQNPLGWVTQPFFNHSRNSLIVGYHRPNELASIASININTGLTYELTSLPTPSLIGVASTAYDETNGLLFYTTNNNELYRDIWVYDIKSEDKKLLFEDYRIGHLSVSPGTRELWGIQHSGGKATLCYSEYPYNKIEQLIGFDIGDEVHQLSINKSGTILCAVIKKSNGHQFIAAFECEKLKQGNSSDYLIFAESGSPENPSWSNDGLSIFWNAYTNGVSNIYRYNLIEKNTEALTNTVRGFFKPIEITKDSLFAFEFSTDGFYPVMLENKPASHLPAIQYLGQQVIDKDTKVLDLIIKPGQKEPVEISAGEIYNGFSYLDVNTFIPVITGFLSQKVLGFYLHVADPIINHDFTMELGVSPFRENGNDVRFHLKTKYDYKKKYEFAINYNAPDFYDLVNKRKKGMLGSRFLVAHNHFWVYDNPLKIKQRSEISVFTGVEYFIDNNIRVSEPDFIVAQTNLNSKNIRRSVGSVDLEDGNEFNFTLLFFASNPDDPHYTGQVFAEWDHYTTWLIPHNVFHFKLASGYHKPDEKLFQAKYFLGGFGNRELENVSVRQYRNIYRFPGVPIYSIFADNFGQILIENSFPPVSFGGIELASHFLDNINISLFSKSLIINLDKPERFINAGGQINFVFKHWFNLESTFSAGIAKAWFKNGDSDEWFLSFKLLKN